MYAVRFARIVQLIIEVGMSFLKSISKLSTAVKSAKRKKVSQQFSPADGGDVPALDVPGNTSKGIEPAGKAIFKRKKNRNALTSLLGG